MAAAIEDASTAKVARTKWSVDVRSLPTPAAMAIDAIVTQQPGSKTYRVMTAVAYYAGLRPSEVVMLRVRSAELPADAWGRLDVTEADISFDEPDPAARSSDGLARESGDPTGDLRGRSLASQRKCPSAGEVVATHDLAVGSVNRKRSSRSTVSASTSSRSWRPAPTDETAEALRNWSAACGMRAW